MELIYTDKRILICVKPAGVLSTDEPGGLPSLVREALGDGGACLRTVHRLDRVASGLMVLARSRAAASILGKEIMEGRFEKEYFALVHGTPAPEGTLRDLLGRDRAARRTYVASAPGKEVREAALDYRRLASGEGLSLVRIRLGTGRTHQIRAQFSSRGFPLAGDRKYGAPETDPWGVALWSCRLAFDHPETGERIDISLPPPAEEPWTFFKETLWNT